MSRNFCIVAVSCWLTLFVVANVNAQSAPPTNKPAPKNAMAVEAKMQEVQHAMMSLKEAQNRREVMRKNADLKFDELEEKQVPASAYSATMQMLQTQRVELTIELAGLDARRKMITDIIAQQLAKKTKKKPANAAEIQLLERYVANQSQIAEQVRKMVDVASASKNQYREAQQKLIEAQLKLEKAKALGGVPQENDSRVLSLRQQLNDVALDHASVQARLDVVTRLLKQYVDSRGAVSDYEQYMRNYLFQQDRESKLKIQISELESQLRQLKFNDH